jgi:spermidine synthase
MSEQKAVFANGWFREESVCWPGQAQGLKVKAVLHEQQTEFQHLTVFENDGPWGKVMTLDGAIQLTDKDEFVYHEMMAHVPLNALKRAPKNVLIVGGGDGGVMREVLRHPSVERCDLVDIDGAVIEVSKKLFPQVAVSFADKRANAIVGDGAAFVANAAANSYDVIIVDSSDPEGPASVLFGEAFYKAVFAALRPGGIVCLQGESVWLHMGLVQSMAGMLSSPAVGFKQVKYGMIYIPTYPCGSIGALVGAKAEEDGSHAELAVPRADAVQGEKYYSSAMHAASFVLPQFAASLNA